MTTETKFKQTEIGLIPEDWEVKDLEEEAEINMGQSPKSEYYNQEGEGIRFLQGIRTFGDKYPEFDTYTTKITKKGAAGSVLFSVRAPVGEVNITKNDLCIGRGISAINMKNGNNEFLYYLLKHFKTRILNFESGSVFGSINGKQIKELKFAFPKEIEQSSIAKILSDLDLRIELLQKQNETLEKIGQAIFKHWFVDFEFPNEEGKPYKSSGGKMVESELGEIPEGWSVGKLGEKIKTVLGGTPSKSKPEYWEGNIPWINSGAINDFPVMNFSETISELGLKNSAAKLMPKGTVVLPFVISVGKEVRISVLGIESSGNQSVLGILENEEYSSEFIYNWIQLRKGHLYLSATGGAQQHINKGNVDSMELLIPEKKILTNFNMATKNVFNKIYLNSEAILSLQKTRDLLLPKLMTGKIRVPLEVEG